jgi:hypothetical protein
MSGVQKFKNWMIEGNGNRKPTDLFQVLFVGAVWTFLFVLLFATQGCAERSEDNNPLSSDVKLHVEVVPNEKANDYSVRLLWDTANQPQAWVIHRKLEGKFGDAKQVAAVPGDGRSTTDRIPQPGARYVYYLGAINDPHYLLKAKALVQIPKDFEVRDQEVLPSQKITGFNRLFFYRGSRLSTAGLDLSIDVNEIISDAGVIETFPEKQAALVGALGRSGGNISIKAKTGKGLLYVFGRGENGGAGAEGKVGAPGKSGRQGRGGLTTHEKVEI